MEIDYSRRNSKFAERKVRREERRPPAAAFRRFRDALFPNFRSPATKEARTRRDKSRFIEAARSAAALSSARKMRGRRKLLSLARGKRALGLALLKPA